MTDMDGGEAVPSIEQGVTPGMEESKATHDEPLRATSYSEGSGGDEIFGNAEQENGAAVKRESESGDVDVDREELTGKRKLEATEDKQEDQTAKVVKKTRYYESDDEEDNEEEDQALAETQAADEDEPEQDLAQAPEYSEEELAQRQSLIDNIHDKQKKILKLKHRLEKMDELMGRLDAEQSDVNQVATKIKKHTALKGSKGLRPLTEKEIEGAKMAKVTREMMKKIHAGVN